MTEQFLSCYGSCSKAVQTMTETFAPKVMSQLQSSKTELLHQLSVYAPPFYSFIFFSFFLIFLLFRSNDELVHFLEEQQGAQKYLNSYLVEISSADQRRSSMISDFTFALLFTIFFQLKLIHIPFLSSRLYCDCQSKLLCFVPTICELLEEPNLPPGLFFYFLVFHSLEFSFELIV